jgi:hypothetical protein
MRDANLTSAPSRAGRRRNADRPRPLPKARSAVRQNSERLCVHISPFLRPTTHSDQLFRFRHLHEHFTRSGVNSAPSVSHFRSYLPPPHKHSARSFLTKARDYSLAGRGGPWRCETSRLSRFLESPLTERLTRRTPFTRTG